MSRDSSPKRLVDKREGLLTRQKVLNQIHLIFQPFQYWAEHILLTPITKDEHFCGVDKTWNFDRCLAKITKYVWNHRLKLPRAENHTKIFIFICAVSKALNYNYRFQIYYHCFLTTYLSKDKTINWSYIRSKINEDCLSCFVRLLSKNRVPWKIDPNDPSKRKLIKLEKFIENLENYYEEPESRYEAIYKVYREDCAKVMKSNDIEIPTWTHCHAQFCYKYELLLSQYAFDTQCLIIFCSYDTWGSIFPYFQQIIDRVVGTYSSEDVGKCIDILKSLGVNKKKRAEFRSRFTKLFIN